MRRASFIPLTMLFSVWLGGPALACGGLIGPNGAVNLLRTSTLAGYAGGVEHYVTSFEFAGGGGEFGSIVPLPDVPTKVERGGDWTLQRLVREVRPPAREFEAALSAVSQSSAKVILEARIDALDITILEGGGDEVGTWAKDHGFRLPPDAPEVLDFYAARSPIFMAARFDADAARARGQSLGDGTPIHLTIPTDDPWVPLRILALGKQGAETVEADVFLLTERKPRILPRQSDGSMTLERSEWASELLVSDLKSDKGMEWVPDSAWLTYIAIDSTAGELDFDLALSVDGSLPSHLDAGLSVPAALVRSVPTTSYAVLAFGLLLIGMWVSAGKLSRQLGG